MKNKEIKNDFFLSLLKKGTTIITPEQKKIINKKKEKLKNKNKGKFVMLNLNFVKDYWRKLGRSGNCFIGLLTENIQFNSCLIMFDDNYPMRTIQNFVDKTQMSNKTVIKILDQFIKSNIVFKYKEHGNTSYFINPCVFYCGDNIKREIDNLKDKLKITDDRFIIKL